MVTLAIQLKPGIYPEKLSSGDQRIIRDQLSITEVKPEISRKMTIKVFGMPLNSSDSLVQDLMEFFGGGLKSTAPIMET